MSIERPPSETQGSAVAACAERPCCNADGRQEATGKFTPCVDYDPQFVVRMLTFIEAGRARAERVGEVQRTVTNIEEIERRVGLYQSTGLRDYLVDVAQFAMQEWIEAGEVRRGVCG